MVNWHIVSSSRYVALGVATGGNALLTFSTSNFLALAIVPALGANQIRARLWNNVVFCPSQHITYCESSMLWKSYLLPRVGISIYQG